ncbi:MAG: hypothetical protein QM767_08455 [Anaeromyxobacter sp.]
MHPNGQIPAYEWNFGDVNPPVHAWATIFTYRLEKAQRGQGDMKWLKSSFQKLLLNFTWWVNRKDRTGRNVFEGGFLGLDNIGVFDRSAPLPTGGLPGAGRRHRLDGALRRQHAGDRHRAGDDRRGLPRHGPQVHRALHVDRLVDGAPRAAGSGCGTRKTASSTTCSACPTAQRAAAQGPVDGGAAPPAAPPPSFEPELLAKYPKSCERFELVPRRPPRAVRRRSTIRGKPGVAGRRLFSILDETKLRRVLAKMLDENEFLSPYGIRSLSRFHDAPPLRDSTSAARSTASTTCPAESDSGMFGGNSNWRGPIWMPVNLLDHPRPAQLLLVLRRRLHRGVPHRLRAADEPLPGRRGAGAPALADIFLKDAEGTPPGLRRRPRSSRPTRTGASTSSSTSTSTATTAPASGPATRPAGPGPSPGSCTCSPPPPRSRC